MVKSAMRPCLRSHAVKLRPVRHPAPVADSTRLSGRWLAEMRHESGFHSPIVGQPAEFPHGLPVGMLYIESLLPELSKSN
jgi:hypothetical protein